MCEDTHGKPEGHPLAGCNGLLRAALLATVVLALPGCVAAVVGGAAVTALSVHDPRTTGTQLDDHATELRLINAIGKDPELHAQAHVDGTCYDGVLLLTGETPSETLRQRAADIARRLPKVRKVVNELRIAAPSSLLARSGDAWVTAQVKTALLTAKHVDALNIKVTTEAGTVYLMGRVPRDDADRATDIARHVGGVQRVVRLFETPS